MSTPEASLEPIPHFTIDLARPPRERYYEVVRALGPRMRSLTGVYENVLSIFISSSWLRSIAVGFSKLFLRRVCDEEENEELKGISEASGVPFYLLVALNNLLDCLLGCTSGVVPASVGRAPRRADDITARDHIRLLHFRTLDWGMDELRDLLVVLEFVDTSADDPEYIIARSITYAGFVGTLTAVRPGLSISLNHRPCHDCTDIQLRWHQLLVILGKRKSVGSMIRSWLFHAPRPNSKAADGAGSLVSQLTEDVKALVSTPSAPCYLTLCDGRESVVVVKDYVKGTTRSTRGFIAQTNHDPEEHELTTTRGSDLSCEDRRKIITSVFNFEGWMEESTDRLQCIQCKWDRIAARRRARNPQGLVATELHITEKTLRKWMLEYPTLNESSHFATILDPRRGMIRWLVRGPVDLDDPEADVQYAQGPLDFSTYTQAHYC